MGYETSYSLETYPAYFYQAIEGQLKDITNYEYLFEGSHKWYNCEGDVSRVSRDNSGIYIALTGDGDSSGDNWRKIWLNGELIFQETLEFRPLSQVLTTLNKPDDSPKNYRRCV